MVDELCGKGPLENVRGAWLAVLQWMPTDEFHVLMLARQTPDTERAALALGRDQAAGRAILVRIAKDQWGEAEEKWNKMTGDWVLGSPFASWNDSCAKFLETMVSHLQTIR